LINTALCSWVILIDKKAPQMTKLERRDQLAEDELRGIAEKDERHKLISYSTSNIVNQARYLSITG
jgi:hypothetical protein